MKEQRPGLWKSIQRAATQSNRLTIYLKRWNSLLLRSPLFYVTC